LIRRLKILGIFVALIGSLAACEQAVAGAPMCRGQEATVVGTAGSDEFDRFDLRDGDVVALLAGDDEVSVEDVRNVTVCGGSGRDQVGVEEAGGTFIASGGPGRDYLGCSCSDDYVATVYMRLFGGPGADRLLGGGWDDVVRGGAGDDLIVGLYGNDDLSGDGGDDRVFGSQDDDTVRGGDGDDRISGDYRGGEGQTSGWEPPGTDRAVGGGGFDRCRAETTRECEQSF
jgi:Ca2+-binding RTX toxin-like protein